jgi:hypothetical protein
LDVFNDQLDLSVGLVLILLEISQVDFTDSSLQGFRGNF